VIDEARGRHAAFDLTRHPSKVVLQYLSGYVRELQSKVARIDPDVLRTDIAPVALPLAVHANGIPLPENHMVVEAIAFNSAQQGFPIDIIPAAHRNDLRVRPASAWQVGNVLFLTSPATLWTRITSIAVATVATATALVTGLETITLPDAARLALVEKCAAFMARRLPVDPKAPLADARMFQSVADTAEESYLADVANNLTGKMFLTRDVYRPSEGV
jgi:hypothetical protein